jgi:hypothetical protein
LNYGYAVFQSRASKPHLHRKSYGSNNIASDTSCNDSHEERENQGKRQMCRSSHVFDDANFVWCSVGEDVDDHFQHMRDYETMASPEASIERRPTRINGSLSRCKDFIHAGK